MRMRLNPNACFLIALSVLMLAVIIESAGFSYPEARVLPIVVAGLVLVLALAELGKELRGGPAGKAAPETEGGVEGSKILRRRLLLEGAWLVGFCLAVSLFGFLTGMILFVFSYLAAHGRRWREALAAAVLTTVTLYGTFSYVLGVKLYSGIILDLLAW